MDILDIPGNAKEKLLADLKAGAVNVVALHPLKQGEQDLFDEVMGKLRLGTSWLGLAVGKDRAIFYEWPLAERMARDYDDLSQLLKQEGYRLLHIEGSENLKVYGQILRVTEQLLQERQILLLFDYDGYPGDGRMVSFFIVPMDGFEAHNPGFSEILRKLKG